MKVLTKLLYILTLLVACSWQVQAESVNDQAKQALSLGHVTAAEDLLNKQVQAKPDDYQAWFLLGVAQAQGKHFHQAIEAFRRVIELRNDLAEPHNNLAVIYNELGDVKSAVHELEQSLQKHPGYAIAEENIADLYVKLALQYYKKSLLKNDNPALKQRYARLLQVRDTRSSTKEDVAHVVQTEKSKKTVATVLKHAAPSEEVVSSTVPVKVQNKAASKVALVQEQSKAASKVVSVKGQDKVESKVAKSMQPEQLSDKKVANIGSIEKTNKASEVEAVLASLEAWRVAWQSQDLDAYFSAYASDYIPTGKYASLAAWKAYKKRVIANKAYIKLDLSDIKVELSEDGNVARVRFNQAFHSNNYNGNDVKVLKLEKGQKGWKILREAAISL